ncbi:MAG: EamA family transporter [Steroidobacteraceae bacterium]
MDEFVQQVEQGWRAAGGELNVAQVVVTGSYGHVNPVVAALLDSLVLGERLSWIQIAGMVVTLIGTTIMTGYWRPLPTRQTAN